MTEPRVGPLPAGAPSCQASLDGPRPSVPREGKSETFRRCS